MKKIISAILAFMLLLSANVSFAYDELETDFEQATFFPETYLGSLSRPFSRRMTLEDVLVRGWQNLDESIDVYSFNLYLDDFTVEYRGIWSEHPEIYYLTNGFGYSYYEHNGKKLIAAVYPDYTETNRNTINNMLTQIEEATDEILLLINDDMTDFEKVMTVHNYMVLEYEYDNSYTNYDATIMVTKTGVCQAYAFAFKHLMNELEIPCVFVPSIEMVHGWNLVYVDGNWYHIDLTWDDLSDDQYARVSNKNALLSDKEIQALDKPHYNYDTKGLEATSSIYDKAEWHNSDSEVVSIHGTSYWASENSIISSKGKVIFANLDEGLQGWSTDSGIRFSGIYTGLAVHNDILYFNTDQAIYSYNPKKDKEPVKIKDIVGVCGLFIHNNVLKYNKCEPEEARDPDTDKLLGYYLHFRPNGEIKLSNTRFGCPRYENGRIVVRVYKEDNSPLCIYSSGDTIDVKTVRKSNVSKVYFDVEDEQTIFFWNEKMQPLTEKKLHKNN